MAVLQRSEDARLGMAEQPGRVFAAEVEYSRPSTSRSQQPSPRTIAVGKGV